MKGVQKLIVLLFQLNGLGYSIYYYVEASDQSNLAGMVCQALIILFVIICLSKIRKTQFIGSIFGLQLSMMCQIIANYRNLELTGFLEVVVIHCISTYLFEDLIRHENYQIQARYRVFLIITLLQSTTFLLIYLSLSNSFDFRYYRGWAFLVISLLLNLARVYAESSILRTKNFSGSVSFKIDQAVLRKDRISSLVESEKISPENTSSRYLQMFRSENSKHQSQLNSNILDVTMAFTNEGLIVLSPKNQKYDILYSNNATRQLFQVNSTKEILGVLLGLTNLTFMHHVSQEDSLMKQHQQQQLCKSTAFQKSDFLASTVKNNFQFLFETHSNKNCASNLEDLFDKFEANNFSEFFIVHLYYPNQQTSISQTEKKNQKLIQLTVVQRENNLFFIMIRDITHRQKIRYLREYDIQKSKMLSYVSHEYRSPLNCIIQMIENIVNSKQLNPEHQEMLQAALDNSYYILNLSNDLLDLAQIKNGKFAIQRSQFNLEQLIKECLKLFALKAKIINLELYYIYDSQAPHVIISDRNRLKQILVNLLSNSFKFASKKIEINVVLICETCLRIGVQDDGIGISEEDQKKLFRSFSKVNSEESRKRNDQGVGLGLVISNQIAFSMGCGGLQLESKPNQGTHFFLDIQIQSSRLKKVSSIKIREVSIIAQEVIEISVNNLEKKPSIELGPPTAKCYHILVVDDEIFNIFTFTKLLNNKDINDIDSASNGNECLEKVKNKKCCEFCTGYKIIFMDIDMPVLNGQNAAKLLLQSDPGLIIVACSGYTDLQEKEKCLQIGMVDYIVKPIRDQELTYVLKAYYS